MQGGALALMTAINSRYKLAAVVVMSGFVPTDDDSFKTQLRSSINLETPVLVCHGAADQMIPLASAEHVVNMLRSSQVPVELKVYEGLAHGFSALENSDICAFAKKMLPPIQVESGLAPCKVELEDDGLEFFM